MGARFSRSFVATLAVVSSLLPSSPAGALQPHVQGADIVAELRAGGAVDYDGVVVVDGLDLAALGTVAQTIRCTRCTIAGALDARDVTFERLVDLSGSLVEGSTNVEGATFLGPAVFGVSDDGITFREDVAARLADFRSRTRFDGARFAAGADFRLARFREDVSFRDADFDEMANFDGAAFEAQSSFAASPGATEGVSGCATYVRAGAFSGPASFERAAFGGAADFRSRCFEDVAAFRRATFTGAVDLTRAFFLDEAVFTSVTFASGAAFNASTFKDMARLNEVSAAAVLDFDGTTFDRRVSFAEMRSTGTVALEGAELKAEANAINDITISDLVMDIEQVARFDDPEASEQALRLIERSAQQRGDLQLANSARFERNAVERHRGPAILLDFAFRNVAGYWVRPLRPLLWLLVSIVIATGARGLAARRGFAAPLQRTLRIAFGKKPESSGDDPALDKWIEFAWYKVLIAVALIGLANSNPTLRQMLDSVL